MLLTRDEVAKAVKVARSSSIYPPYIYPSDKALLEAQLKKVVEFIDWLDNGTRSSASWRFEMRKFRQALLKEIENGTKAR